MPGSRKLPGPAALLLAQRFGRRILAALPGPQAHADGLFQRLGLADEHQLPNQMIDRGRRQAMQQELMRIERTRSRRERIRAPPSSAATFCSSPPVPSGKIFSAATTIVHLRVICRFIYDS
ncbi:hypothetical protein AJ87_47380 [Rhizobium yanglingense]|nr:hypothetical protein AJ87_47380 [Rhizobium yanglingense]